MKLTELPNVGPVLASHLEAVGLSTAETFRVVGACEAFARIRLQVDAAACFHQLTALAGAEAGVRKTDLSPERKAELRTFFDRLGK